MMAADEPPYLTVGTDVSAKYKGAFCEAKIKKVIRVVKCKVTFKNNLGSFMITDDLIKGSLRIGSDIEAKHPEKNQFLDAVINKLQDYSQYTVVFDDGDETTLRRTSLCLKSGRHFAESPTLDQFPLTNPEHFGTPVIGAKYKRKRRSTLNSSLDYESSDEDILPRKLKAIRGKERDPDLGKVVCVDYGDRRKKDNWYPGLIVPHPPQSNIKLSKEEHMIRSFKDGKYYQVPKKDTREFTRDNLHKIENNALKIAVDKAVLYLEKEELPPHWDKALFLSLELPSADEESNDFDSDTSDDEPSEEKDRFVAQLYKFMDERGTPINKAPTVSNRDLNLYKLFKIMHKLGGYNKVTNKNKWKAVYSKMGLPASNINGPNQTKFAYKRYLQSFEDFYRKLGCTMVTNSRSTRGRHRSDRNYIITRTRERDTSSPKGRSSKDKGVTEKKTDEKVKSVEKKEVKSEDNSKSEEKVKTPEKKKIERRTEEKEKDEKRKRDEKPRLVRQQSLNKDKKENVKEEEKKETKPEKARTREDARKEKNESPEKKGTRSSAKIELERKEREEALKEKKDKSPKEKDKKEEKIVKENKEEKFKEKKEEKVVKDRKLQKDKKNVEKEEKPIREKRENVVREKKDEKLTKEKRDSSKEPKEDKVIKAKKEDAKSPVEEKSLPKKKLDRVVKEKKEEKVVKTKRDDKSPSSDVSKKSLDDSDSKSIKEEKLIKVEVEIKKEDLVMKEKSRQKLKEKRDDAPVSEDGDAVNDADTSDEKDNVSQDDFERRGPGMKLREDSDEPPNKGKRRSLKMDDKEDKESLPDLTDSDDEFGSEKSFSKDVKHNEIIIGDRVKVKYGRGRMQKVYEAKVLKIEMDGTEKRFYVHYAGWNMRYDEWVRKSYIVSTISSKQKSENPSKSPLPSTSMKKIDKTRPPGVLLNTKPVRKNSTSSTNSSVSCSRATRSDKKNLNSSLSGGLEPRKRARRKSGPTVGLTDTSQESESDGEEPLDLDDDDVGDADIEDNTLPQNDCCFKEELFSDDEEKEKLEDVKRGDITELEKAISVEENTDDMKDEFLPSITKESVEEKPLIDAIAVFKTEMNIKKEVEENIVKNIDVVKDIIKNENETSKSILEDIKPLTDVSLSADVSKNTYSDVIKPAKIIFSPSPLKVEPEKPSFLPLRASPLSTVISNTCGVDYTSKSNSNNSTAISISSNAAASTVISPLVNKPVFSAIGNSPVKLVPSVYSTVSSIKTITSTLEPLKPLAKTMPLSVSSIPSAVVSSIGTSPTVTGSSTINRSCLSFAGLHGLIQKSAFEKIITPEKVIPQENLCQRTSPESSLKSSLSISSVMFDSQLKPSSNFKPERQLTFGSNSLLNTPQKLESTKNEEVGPTRMFGYMKQPAIIDQNKDKLEEDKKVQVDNTDNKILEKPKECLFFSKLSESKLSIPSISPFKANVLSPAKFTCNADFSENKPRDNFDLLVQNSSSYSSKEHKKADISDNVFSLSFSSQPPKEKFTLEKPYISVSPENLCCIKSTPSETVDLSKTIPSILERLKKDIPGQKITDSPPPQKELNFDFLRGSQDSKCLSRSDSSNSLRICEDMSDTNDSNTDSKDIILGDKVDASSIEKVSKPELIPSSDEKDLDKKSELVPVLNLPVIYDSINSDKDKEVKQSQKTSVITVAASLPIACSPIILKDEKDSSKDCSSHVIVSSEKGEELKNVTSLTIKSEQLLESDKNMERNLDNASLLKDFENSSDKISSESFASDETSKTVANNSSKIENQNSLFDDLLKIKCSKNSFTQSSVIMHGPETEKSVICSSMDTDLKDEVTECIKTDSTCSSESLKNDSNVQSKEEQMMPKNISLLEKDAIEKDVSTVSHILLENKLNCEVTPNNDEDCSNVLPKKEGKRKKLSKKLIKKFGSEEDKDMKIKEGKSKSKKRSKLEDDSDKNKDFDRIRAKKIKKNKNKKRFAKHDDQIGDHSKKGEFSDELRDNPYDKMKRKERRRNEKKLLKSGVKMDEFSDVKGELTKKKKGKKNRDKFNNEKKDFFEKKAKRKRKLNLDDNQDTDSEKDMQPKMLDKKKKKERKKFKAKDCSSSDDAADKYFNEQNKEHNTLSSCPGNLLRQESKSDDPDMSFLLCEEKVPASPVDISNLGDDTSGSSSVDGNRINEIERLPLANVYPCMDNIEASDSINKHNIDTSAVLDNTPPTTPSSTESLLSSSPSHERDSFSINYPESTQSGRESCEGDSDIFRVNANRTVMRGSEEYRAAATLAFAVCKSVSDRSKEDPGQSFPKRSKIEPDDHIHSKRKKKSKRIRRCSESAKSPRHKSSFSRMPKIENCEDSSGASPATSNSPPYGSTSNLNFTRCSPHRLHLVDGMSRYNFYVPLHDKDPEKRIAVIQEKMAELRKEYMALRAKVIAIDHKRRKARKKIREAAGTGNINPSLQSEDGQSCS